MTVKAISSAQKNPLAVNDSVLREWRESATYWEKHAQTIRTMFAPLTRALIEEAGIREGAHVLDVAGGPGEPSLTIAEVVGSSGSVLCTDVVAEMVAAAEREARRRRLTNIQFQQASADSLPFGNNTFDAAVCRLGVMFFPDSLAGVTEMVRVTKPAGNISFAVWAKSELNPFSYVITNIVARHIETPAADPNALGAFRFAESGALAQVLTQAGARNVTERALRFHIEAPITPKEFWEMRSQTSGTLREKLQGLPKAQTDGIAQDVEQSLGEFFPNNQMKFPAEMLVITGTK